MYPEISKAKIPAIQDAVLKKNLKSEIEKVPENNTKLVKTFCSFCTVF